jgi:alpha-1,2-mannosyltransferase
VVPARAGARIRTALAGAGRGRWLPRVGIAGPLLVLAALIWALFVDVVPRSDLEVFLRAGSDVLHGRDPYPALDSPFLYSGRAFVYPYAAAVPFVPLSLLPFGVADVLFFLLSVAAVLFAGRLAEVTDLRCYLFALGAATTVRSFQVGSLNALLMLGCVVAWCYRERALASASSVAAVVVSKLFLVPLGAWFAITRRWYAVAVSAGITAVVVGLGWLLGPMGAADYLKMLSILSDHETHAGWSLHRLLIENGAGPGAARVGTALAAAAVILLAWLAYHRGADEVVVFAATISAALLASPIVWSHYFLLLLAPLLVARVRWFVLAAFAVACWFIAPPPGMDDVSDWINGLTTWKQRATGAQLMIVATVVAVGLTARRRRSTRSL